MKTLNLVKYITTTRTLRRIVKIIKMHAKGVNDILGKTPKSTFINNITYDNKKCT